MTFLDYVFLGVTVVASLLTTMFVLHQAQVVAEKRLRKQRLATAQEFTERLRAELGLDPDVEMDTETGGVNAAPETPHARYADAVRNDSGGVA